MAISQISHPNNKIIERSTIFAIATGSSYRGAIAIMRLSGAETAKYVTALAGTLPQPRRVTLLKLWGCEEGDLLDEALVLWFPAPRSYTGEDCAEFHIHASPAIIEALSNSLVNLGARPAEPGEFSRRAFVNGRIDLIQAEAIVDLIEAETQTQRKQALNQMQGQLGKIYKDWVDRLKNLLAHQEALIDFPEDDLPSGIEEKLENDLFILTSDMMGHVKDGRRAEKVRSGLSFAIIGKPNVGKSSLLNYLVNTDAAIVSKRAGTTRDAIEIRCILNDVPVTFIDTAGLRETKDSIEAEGVRRAYDRARQADCVLYLKTAGDDDDIILDVDPNVMITLYTKADLSPGPQEYHNISVLTGKGLSDLQNILIERVQSLTNKTGSVALTRMRHRVAVMDALSHLEQAKYIQLPELRAEELRLAILALGTLTGEVSIEDILDTIFGQFCIGK